MDELFHIPPNQISALLALAKSPEMEQLGVAGISFRGADLRGVLVEDAVWPEIDLEEADLSKASLQNASLQGANLSRAKLRAIDLSNADLRASNLNEADLREANLTGVNMREASLQRADLRESNLRGADLLYANLDGTRLENAIYDSNTKWPTAFNINSSNAIHIWRKQNIDKWNDILDSPPEVTLVDLQEFVQLALRQWHSDSGTPSPFASLHLFRQLRQSEAISEHDATNRVLYQALQLLEERHPQEALLLRRSELDNGLNDFVANALNVAPSTLYRYKKSAIIHLAEVLSELEAETRTGYRARMLARLAPPSYTQLRGVNHHLRHLSELLNRQGAPWIVALTGMEGIGKTSLADEVVRGLINQGALYEVGWVTARQIILHQQVAQPALTLEALAEELCTQLLNEGLISNPSAPRNAVSVLHGLLKERPHLIVIDNLETVADIESLVVALQELAAPSRFLLTSRESLFTQPDIYHYAVPELSAADALALIRHEAEERNLALLQQANIREILPIIDIVGGNPLALRLIVGLTYIYPLAEVLEILAKARDAQIENLYDNLYHHAWQRLDEVTQRMLLTMPLVTAAEANLDHLVEISKIDQDKAIQALETLVRLNLVDVRGDLNERRYTIHNLTRTFLYEQVLRWQ